MEWRERKATGSTRVWHARTSKGTAIVHDLGDRVLVDIWAPDQHTIGTGVFPTVNAAKQRAETVLNPRNTAWDLLGLLLPDEV
jgi:hypothetical protein